MSDYIEKRLKQHGELEGKTHNHARIQTVIIAAAIDELRDTIDSAIRESSHYVAEQIQNVAINMPTFFKDPNRY